MIKLIKYTKKEFLPIAGLKQRDEYLKVMNNDYKSFSIDFNFLNYSLKISGLHLLIPILISLYISIVILEAIGINTGAPGACSNHDYRNLIGSISI